MSALKVSRVTMAATRVRQSGAPVPDSDKQADSRYSKLARLLRVKLSACAAPGGAGKHDALDACGPTLIQQHARHGVELRAGRAHILYD
jgi:hypothetical protein